MAGNDLVGSKLARLPLDFYTRTDVVQIARELLGKVLVTEFDGQRTAGRITETEAYCAPDDRASHAYGNRRTARTEVMFQEGGRAYVYLCYGIHHLFNVVTGAEGMAHAVLIRALEPVDGSDIMQQRRYASRKKGEFSSERSDDLESSDRMARTSSDDSKSSDEYVMPKHLMKMPALTTGPGSLSQALGLTKIYTGQSLVQPDSPIWIEDSYEKISEDDIAAGPRIGVDYAGECAAWPWRFWLKNSPFVKK